MVQTAQSKRPIETRPIKSKGRTGGIVSYLITGDAEALENLVVPKGLTLKRFKQVARKSSALKDPLGRKPAAGNASVPPKAFEPDAKAKALLAGVRISEQILEEAGGAFELKDVILLLNNVSRQAVDRRVQDNNLLAVPGPGNRRWYPTLQFTDQRQIVDGLKPVLDALPTDNPWVALSFLSQPNDQLAGDVPIKLLKSGEIDRVVRAARGLSEPGA